MRFFGNGGTACPAQTVASMRQHLSLFVLLFLPLVATATHNRAGEIVVRAGECGSGDELSVCATIITYTETDQTEVDRDSLELNWGDGTTQMIGRTAIDVTVAPNIQRNEYTFCHRYPAAGRYVLSFSDVNRVRGVRNISNSVNISFSVYTSYLLIDPLFGGCNTSPQLTQDPIDVACTGSVWTHNPGAFDVDGDSLAFEFTTPSFTRRTPIANYLLPNMVGGSTGSLEIDPRTGQITWDTPVERGEYNLAFLIKSFRNGIPLDTVVRDMQVFVEDCANDPPEIIVEREEICVVAGEIIEFDVTATAPLTDTDQLVSLEANGRPFEDVTFPATFLPDVVTPREDPVVRRFRWETSCDDISNQEYFVVLRAVDNGPPRPNGLATLKTISIKVVAPPPEDLQTELDDEAIRLSWAAPYACEDGTDPNFEGFTVWRREGSNNFAPDTCETGLEGRGYTLLTPDEISQQENGRYFYVDTDVERGRTYCYRVVALMARRTEVRNLIFEEIESIPSEEICVQLARDIPLLTKVDVTETDAVSGAIDVCWILPQPNSLDTLTNAGPYRYVLSRATGLTTDPAAFTEIATFNRQFFAEPVDTCYSDVNLNTRDNAYSYRIELFVEGENEPVGEAQPATSVRLSGDPTDQATELDWAEIVPWTNASYDIFRRDPGSQTLDSLTSVTEQSYRDTGLVNGLTYCYVIRAVGSYGVEDIPGPLLNRSQELCLTVEDDIPPCPPVLSVESVCDRGVDCTDESNLFNTLTWLAPSEVCGVEDVAGYRVYFSSDSLSGPTLIANVESSTLLTLDHTPDDGIVGCYYVTAVDGNGNESELSNQVCVVNCPIYDLPNVFTPNGDGRNDLFVPRGLCFVERVDLQIFNRWGQLVFQTEDPAINWDGNNLNGENLPAGTYFYKGLIFERRLSGTVISDTPVSGYIELVREE
jgi:gliding motility-associated-like protein